MTNMPNGMTTPTNKAMVDPVRCVVEKHEGIAIAEKITTTKQRPVTVPQIHPLRFFLSANL